MASWLLVIALTFYFWPVSIRLTLAGALSCLSASRVPCDILRRLDGLSGKKSSSCSSIPSSSSISLRRFLQLYDGGLRLRQVGGVALDDGLFILFDLASILVLNYKGSG